MVELTEQQIDLISAYIKQNGIAQDELHEDLLDHVCTSIERLMTEGESFEAAFDQTLKLFGPGGLKQVQQQTFELLTEMNTTMKKVTFSFGLTSTILLLAGTIFKLLHLPGAGIMVTLGAGLMSLIYLPLILVHKLKESPANERLMHISGFLGLCLTVIGSLFKIMHWPGARVILISGLFVLGLVYIPIFFYKRYQSSANKPVTLSMGLVALTCLIIVFALTSTRSSRYHDQSMALINTQLVESREVLESRASEFESNASIAELNSKANASIDLIERIKEAIVLGLNDVEGIEEMPLGDIKGLYDYGMPKEVLFGKNNEGGMIEELMASLRDYDAELNTVNPEFSLPVNMEDEYDYRGDKWTWSYYYFYERPVLSVLSQLSKLQLDIRQSQIQAMSFQLGQSAVSNPPS